MAVKPTKPLYTARFTIVDTRHYSADELVKAFRPHLEKAGYIVYQTPAINTYIAKYKLEKEGPFPDDDTHAVYETMSIIGPAGKTIGVGMDIVNDPKGSRPILEKRKPAVTAIAWNLGSPANSSPQILSDLLWQFRKDIIANKDKYTGIGWTPIVDTWEKTPYTLVPYPNRPAMPAVLEPKKPVKPKKPIEKKPVVPYYQPDEPKKPDLPIVRPIVKPSIWDEWPLWAGFGAIGALLYLSTNSHEEDHTP